MKKEHLRIKRRNCIFINLLFISDEHIVIEISTFCNYPILDKIYERLSMNYNQSNQLANKVYALRRTSDKSF